MSQGKITKHQFLTSAYREVQESDRRAREATGKFDPDLLTRKVANATPADRQSSLYQVTVTRLSDGAVVRIGFYDFIPQIVSWRDQADGVAE